MKIIPTPSPNFNARPSPIDSIIIHYTDMPSAEAALECLTNSASQVSAHYLICEKGKVYQMVGEEHRAWHAGESSWQESANLNDSSVGIELSNPGHSHGYQAFPEPQIESLIKLCMAIKVRWNIPQHRILGHSDVAPQRKQDPGHLFPWEKLARVELGLWPMESVSKHTGDFLQMLSQFGYNITSPTHALLAFQRHFQPHKVDGIPNQETSSLLQGLLKAQEMLIQKEQMAGEMLWQHRGKSGLHKDTVPDNVRRGRP